MINNVISYLVNWGRNQYWESSVCYVLKEDCNRLSLLKLAIDLLILLVEATLLAWCGFFYLQLFEESVMFNADLCCMSVLMLYLI